MDGLLVDTEPLWFETEAEVMARLGAPWTKEDQEQLLGGSMDNTVGYLLAKATRPASPAEVARWMTDGMLKRAAEGRVIVRPGARELLEEVAAAGIPYALVTGSQRPFTEAVLASTGFRFPVTVTGDDVTRTKPDPEPYLLAAKLLDADPEQLRGPRGLPERRSVRHGRGLPCNRRPVPATHPARRQAPGSAVAKRPIAGGPAGHGRLSKLASSDLALGLDLDLDFYLDLDFDLDLELWREF